MTDDDHLMKSRFRLNLLQGSSTQRRHSLTVVASTSGSSISGAHGAEFNLGQQFGGRPKRRQSVQESLQLITKSMSSSLQKAMHLGGSNSSLAADEGKNRLTKTFFRDILSAHFKQPDLKVTKLFLQPIPNPHTNQVLHEAEVWIKDARGRRKLDLIAKYSRASNNPEGTNGTPVRVNNGWVLDGTNDEMVRELAAYDEVVADMWSYLRVEKGVAEPEQYLCLPVRYRDTSSKNVLTESIDSADDETRKPDILVLQDLFASGYRSAPQDRMDENGLDFNHSIMALTRLARFHSVSYAMRRERQIDMCAKYSFLAQDPVYRPETEAMFAKPQNSMGTRLLGIFQHSSADLRQFSSYFLDAVRNLHSIQSDFVLANEEFGVLCHGDLWRQNVLFFYGSSLESHTDCLDVRFEDLHRVRYASCVTDLLYFLFTTVDSEVRRDHMMDLMAVYYDHFSKTVTRLAPSVEVFSREQLFAEFRSHLMFGFLEGLCLFSAVYESQLTRAENDHLPVDLELRMPSTSSSALTAEFSADSAGSSACSARPPRYADYKDAVVAMISDVVRLQLQG